MCFRPYWCFLNWSLLLYHCSHSGHHSESEPKPRGFAGLSPSRGIGTVDGADVATVARIAVLDRFGTSGSRSSDAAWVAGSVMASAGARIAPFWSDPGTRGEALVAKPRISFVKR